VIELREIPPCLVCDATPFSLFINHSFESRTPATRSSTCITEMTDKLPPNLLALFAPRPGLRFLPPADHAPEDRKTAAISGVAAFLPQLEDYKQTDEYKPTESWLERKFRVKQEKKERQAKLLKEAPALCEGDPICDISLFTCPTSGHLCLVYSQIC
jgi:hypothetical protein